MAQAPNLISETFQPYDRVRDSACFLFSYAECPRKDAFLNPNQSILSEHIPVRDTQIWRVLGYGVMKSSLKTRLSSFLRSCLVLMLASGSMMAQTAHVFRLDGGNSTYAFGVNERGELQTLYWGGRIDPHDTIPAAHSLPEWASFDSPATTTPQEYAGWGA
jgi:hypothetical protein